jgi:hypothetical protein
LYSASNAKTKKKRMLRIIMGRRLVVEGMGIIWGGSGAENIQQFPHSGKQCGHPVFRQRLYNRATTKGDQHA